MIHWQAHDSVASHLQLQQSAVKEAKQNGAGRQLRPFDAQLQCGRPPRHRLVRRALPLHKLVSSATACSIMKRVCGTIRKGLIGELQRELWPFGGQRQYEWTWDML